MKDKNFVILEGIVGNDVQKGTSVNGNNFITFSLCIDTYYKPLHDSTESDHRMVYIRVFFFDQRLITYLNKCKVRKGLRVSVFGRLNSTATDIKGKQIVQVNVVARDVSVFKTKDDYEYTAEEIESMSEASDEMVIPIV